MYLTCRSCLMDTQSVTSEDRYVPSVRSRIDIDSILGKASVEDGTDSVPGEISSILPPATAQRPKFPAHNHKRDPSPDKTSDLPPPSVRAWSRPRLVDAEEFRESLLEAAREIADTSGKLETVEVPVAVVEPDKGASLPPLPEPEPAPEWPRIETRHSVSLSPLVRAMNSPVDEEPRLVSPKNRKKSVSRRNRSRSQSHSPDASKRAARLRERIETHKIISQMMENERSSHVVRGESKKYKKMKRILKDVVMSALNNSRLIRQELVAIHADLVRSPVSERVASGPSRKVVDLITSSPVVIASMPHRTEFHKMESPDPKQSRPPIEMPPVALSQTVTNETPKHAQFSLACARVILHSTVSSPAAIETALNDLTGHSGRQSLKMCTGQPAVHQRALVMVVKAPELEPESWFKNVLVSRHIEAYDRAFPIELRAPPGLPWEVRARALMSSVVPEWVTVTFESPNSNFPS